MNIGEEKKSDIEHFIQYSNLKYENEKTQKLRTLKVLLSYADI